MLAARPRSEVVRVQLAAPLTAQVYTIYLSTVRSRTGHRVLGDKVYTTVIPRNVRVAESPSHGKPVLLYDYKCTGSQAYIQLASEVIERERRIRAA